MLHLLNFNISILDHLKCSVNLTHFNLYRMETIWNYLCCEQTTVSQGPLLDHDKIYSLLESVS